MIAKSLIIGTFLASFFLVSCDKKASETKENTTTPAVEATAVVHTEYVCEMDCEKGKKYEEAGKCPVCKMDLVAKTHEHKAESEEVKADTTEKEHGHSHGEDGHSHDKEAK